MGTIDDDDNAADPVDEVMAAGDEPSASSGGCSVGSSPISAGHLGWLALGRARQVSEPVLREATALGVDGQQDPQEFEQPDPRWGGRAAQDCRLQLSFLSSSLLLLERLAVAA
jgi:hypothetical protein